MDVAPFIENGRVFVPLRYLAKVIGIPDNQIIWDPHTLSVTVTKNNVTTTLTIASNEMICSSGAITTMDVAPVLKDNRMFLPTRYLAEKYGYHVNWDESSQGITISVKEK